MMAAWKIVPAEGREDSAQVRELLEEYWRFFGFSPSFQNFAAEMDGLPGAYQPPAGRLALATAGGEPAGCIALRRVDATTAEAKRLYVRAAYRGRGLGRALLEWLCSEARRAGYRTMIGDTMPEMREALALYGRMGFEFIPAVPGKKAVGIRIPL